MTCHAHVRNNKARMYAYVVVYFVTHFVSFIGISLKRLVKVLVNLAFSVIYITAKSRGQFESKKDGIYFLEVESQRFPKFSPGVYPNSAIARLGKLVLHQNAKKWST